MIDTTFWDKVAPKYAAKPIQNMPAYEATLDRTRSFLHADDHILEVGCGTGGTALLLARHVEHVTATDISAGMIRVALNKLQGDAPRNVTFQRATALDPLPQAPFDAICAFNLLHLLNDLPKALAHIRTQVKPGGFVITKSACLGDMSFVLPTMVKLMRLVGKAPFVNVFTADELAAAFANAGFEVVETGHFCEDKHARFVVARRI